MVQALASEATTIRVADYLQACGLPDTLVASWSAEITAAGGELSDLLSAAQQRRDAWLRDNLPLGDDQQALLVAQASLPLWQKQAELDLHALQRCCIRATPKLAALDMPEQAFSLRSVSHYVDRACESCLPFSRRVTRRIHTWLRSL